MKYEGAKLYLPESDTRYLSAAVINLKHHTNKIFRGEGWHELNADDLGSDHVMVVVRVLANEHDPKDLAAPRYRANLALPSARGVRIPF